MQDPRRNYLGALALNNSAVLLLERGRHRQALTVLADAVAAIREVMTMGDQHDDAEDDGDDDAGRPSCCLAQSQRWMESNAFPPRGVGPPLEAMLQRASRYVMDSVPAFSLYSSGANIESQVLEVDVPQLTLSALDAYLPSGAGATLIRMEVTQCRDFGAGSLGDCGTTTSGSDSDGDVVADPVGDRPHLESLTILHNYATAARLHPLSEQDLRRGTVRATHLAFLHVCRLLCHKLSWARTRGAGVDGDGDGDGDGPGAAFRSSPFEDVALLQMSLQLAKDSYQLSVELGDAQRAGQSLNQYRIVRTAMESEEVSYVRRLGAMSVPHAKAA